MREEEERLRQHNVQHFIMNYDHVREVEGGRGMKGKSRE
jgi:hypothetical protein